MTVLLDLSVIRIHGTEVLTSHDSVSGAVTRGPGVSLQQVTHPHRQNGTLR
jgi:hypothetical protein